MNKLSNSHGVNCETLVMLSLFQKLSWNKNLDNNTIKEERPSHTRNNCLDFDYGFGAERVPTVDEIMRKSRSSRRKKGHTRHRPVFTNTASEDDEFVEIVTSPKSKQTEPNSLRKFVSVKYFFPFFTKETVINPGHKSSSSTDPFEISNSFDPDLTNALSRSQKIIVASQLRMSELDSTQAFAGDEEFLMLVSSKSGYKALRGFLKKEFCQENIDFWGEAVDFRENFGTFGTPEDTLKKASSIYRQFISLKGSRSVNINSATKKTIETQLNGAQSVDSNIFKEAEREVYRLMLCSSFIRFRAIPGYSEILRDALKERSSTVTCKLSSLDENRSSCPPVR